MENEKPRRVGHGEAFKCQIKRRLGGGYLLSRKSTTIGLKVFHFRVRDGNGWDNLSITAT